MQIVSGYIGKTSGEVLIDGKKIGIETKAMGSYLQEINW